MATDKCYFSVSCYTFDKAQRLSCHLAWRSVGLKGSVDILRVSTPTNPQGAPPIGWRHDGVARVVLEFQSGQCHFGSSPRHLPGRIQSASSQHNSSVYARRRQGRRVTSLLPSAPSKSIVLESLVAHSRQIDTHCIPEEILGFAWELPSRSSWHSKQPPCCYSIELGKRTRQAASPFERTRS